MSTGAVVHSWYEMFDLFRPFRAVVLPESHAQTFNHQSPAAYTNKRMLICHLQAADELLYNDDRSISVHP
jgi:hypothetical protein